MAYAEKTKVSPEQSQGEIKRTLLRYGAKRFGIMEEPERGFVLFDYNGLRIQMTVEFPNRSEFSKTDTGKTRIDSSIETQYNQAIKQRWRALLLAIKAKLEAIECGISTIEQEFLAFMIMPDNRPLGDHLIPKMHQIAKNCKLPKLFLTDGE